MSDMTEAWHDFSLLRCAGFPLKHMFGEMALIDGSPRSATAVASEACELAPIDKAAFAHLVRQDPDFALRVMRLLAQRLRQMNESL